MPWIFLSLPLLVVMRRHSRCISEVTRELIRNADLKPPHPRCKTPQVSQMGIKRRLPWAIPSVFAGVDIELGSSCPCFSPGSLDSGLREHLHCQTLCLKQRPKKLNCKVWTADDGGALTGDTKKAGGVGPEPHDRGNASSGEPRGLPKPAGVMR